MPVKGISKYVRILSSAVRGEKPKPFEATWYRKDGTPCLAEFRACFLRKNGRRVGFQVIIRDITERKKTEKMLKEAKGKSETACENCVSQLIDTMRAQYPTTRFI